MGFDTDRLISVRVLGCALLRVSPITHSQCASRVVRFGVRIRGRTCASRVVRFGVRIRGRTSPPICTEKHPVSLNKTKAFFWLCVFL